ncbi:hypothetical protein K0M31_013982 [Melipona bicolor]|uniref:Uncharacterized protein n=1 Tax=Melipona bicolor TaxID=60889 RepID=A0AA40G7P0_9HYME|nr:hypothetical protein K0M31_013982 [Melipona bicolor]
MVLSFCRENASEEGGMTKKMGSVGNEDARMADEGMTVERKRKRKEKKRKEEKRNGNLSEAEYLIETSEEGSALVSGFTECEKFKPARVLLRLDHRKQDCSLSIGEVIKSFYRLSNTRFIEKRMKPIFTIEREAIHREDGTFPFHLNFLISKFAVCWAHGSSHPPFPLYEKPRHLNKVVRCGTR